MKMKKKTLGHILEKGLHVLVWTFMFSTPILFMDRSNNTGIDWIQVARSTGGTFFLFVLFYVNYLWLVPRLFLKSKRTKFIVVNLALCVVCCVCIPIWEQLCHNREMKRVELVRAQEHARRDSLEQARRLEFERMRANMDSIQLKQMQHRNQERRRGPRPNRGPFEWVPLLPLVGVRYPIFFLMRDLLMQIFCIFAAVLIKMNGALNSSERARKEAEYGRTEAELKNLRSQINPHFLLNTLNNIYALILFDQDKAQEAVQDLSKLLRHVLYDNQQTEVTLDSEVEFLEHYIDLMKIRQTADTEVTFEKLLPQPNSLRVAPLLFISLVENAFKHGIRTSEPSFIHIRMGVEAGRLFFDIENSNFPKDQADRSGSGIGLEQVQKRLDLLYAGKYSWNRGVEGNCYKSRIEISLS